MSIENKKNGRKKAILVQILRSAGYGGVESHVHAVLKNIDHEKYHCILISLANVKINKMFKELNIEIIKLDDIKDPSFKSFKNISSLSQILKKISPDIVHLHGIRPIFIGSIASRFAGIKNIVSTMHGSHTLMSMGSTGNAQIFKLYLSKLMHLAGFILSRKIAVVCEHLKDEIRQIYSCLLPFFNQTSIMGKIDIIYNGIDVREYELNKKSRAIRNELGISHDEVVFGTISRLDEPKKGISVFLKAASIFLKKGHNGNFVIIGDGYSKNMLINLSKELGIYNKVHFIGYREDILEIIGSLDIFVLPSLSEGFPIVNLEAMSNDIPIIATDVGGNSEAISNLVNGLIIPPNDENSLANAMIFLHENPKIRKKMGTEGKKIVTSKFTEKIMIDKILYLYEKICEEKNQRQE